MIKHRVSFWYKSSGVSVVGKFKRLNTTNLLLNGNNQCRFSSLKSFDEYNNEAITGAIGSRSRSLRKGEKIVEEYLETPLKELTFEEENIISKDIWQFIEEDLNRIFDCLRCSKDFENCYELAIEVRSDLDLLKSVCERFDQVKLFVERSRMEEEQVAQLKGLISKLEEECELLELSEKIKELEQRLSNLETTDAEKSEEFEMFTRLETPRLILKIVDLLERRLNLLRRMGEIERAQTDWQKAINMLQYHIQQKTFGKHNEGDMDLNRVKFWLNHLQQENPTSHAQK